MQKRPGSFKPIHFVTTLIAAGALLAGTVQASTSARDREIDLKGTTNTRDIGGYQTTDLRTLRHGQVIRSENLSRLTADDFAKLEAIGVKTVIDLRTRQEHDKAPTVWQGDKPPSFYHFPVGDSQNDWFRAQRKLVKKNRFSQKQSLELMKDGYRMIAEEGPDSYRQLMEVVLDEDNWPVLIHCNAGKDRAGIAVTLILEALGVERETIFDEFLLTNELGRSAEKAELMAKESGKVRRMGGGPSADAWLPIVGVHEEMLETFYAHVEKNHGSMDAFLTELGVDSEARAALRDALTTDPGRFAASDEEQRSVAN